MKLICPSCGAIHSAESWLSDANARQCLKIVAELPWEVSRRSLHYIALFRPRSGRGLQWGKALRLLSEVADLVKTNYVQWDNQPARPCTSGTWGQAMEKMIGFPPKRLPLKSHGYLKSVAYEIADDIDRHREKKVIKAEQSGNIHTVNAPEKDEHRTSNVQHRMLNEKEPGVAVGCAPARKGPALRLAGAKLESEARSQGQSRVSVEEIREFKKDLKRGKVGKTK